MTASEIRRDMRELDEVFAKLREARKKVEANDTVSLPNPKQKVNKAFNWEGGNGR